MNDEADKELPERLELRARPRPVRRLNKRSFLMGGTAIALFIVGAAIFALSPSRLLTSSAPRTEMYNTERKQPAEEVSKLPRSYADLPPKLGSPAPGDIGRGMVEGEKKIVPRPGQDMPYQPSAELDVERAERIRQARIAQQARESGLFFRLSDKQRRGPAPATATPAAQPTPFRPTTIEDRDASGANSLLARAGQGPTDRSSEIVPPSQARKLAFVGGRADRETTNPHDLAAAPSPYAVMTGSIIAASLITGVNSDLPGTTIAQVTENVYDTVSGEHLLIPQGTRLIGKYDSVVTFGQKRALLIWNRLIMPNGNSVVIENLPGTDVAGYAGLEDQVDFHTWQLLKGIGLATLLGVGTQLSLGTDESDLVKALRESVQQTTNRAGQRLVERELDVQPTITVRPGWPLRVIVSKDLVLKPYRDIQTARKAG